MEYPKELTDTYEIYEQIGEGGGGTVYRALQICVDYFYGVRPALKVAY